jgi:glyoxylase-like metal-dependent hydrolase (beta-lactamase superfamily II)
MHDPAVGQPFQALPDTHVIPTYWPVPGMGTISMNAFLVRAAEPVLVDTGTAVLGEEFLEALTSLIDPAQLRWIWLTHEDRDHTGSLGRLLELAPRATVLGTFLTFGRAAPEAPLPFERQRIVNPGDVVNVGDRNLRALRPPLFDSPGTLGFLDDRTGALFSSDCFGAPLDPAVGSAASVDDVPPDELTAAQVAWATADSPWVTLAAEDALRAEVETVRGLEPSVLLSSHLPPVRSAVDRSLDAVLAARTADPMPGPTQAELEALLAQFAPTSPDTSSDLITTSGGTA